MAHRPLWRALLPCAMLLSTAVATAPAAHAATDYQAEDATISQGVVESNHAGFTGSGGFIAPKRTWPTSSGCPSGLTIINDYVFVATTVGQSVYRMRIDQNASLVESQRYFQGTYDRLRTVEVDPQGDIWLTTTTDKDGVPNNDRILRVDIQYT